MICVSGDCDRSLEMGERNGRFVVDPLWLRR